MKSEILARGRTLEDKIFEKTILRGCFIRENIKTL